MSKAIELAIDNVRREGGGPFAAVVVRGDEIIATGVNLVVESSDPTAHAEIVAIREACRKLGTFQINECDIYTTCEPCPMCLGAIYWARPARVFFGNTREDAAAIGFDDDLIYRQMLLPIEERSVPMIPLMREQAREIFRLWMEKPGKRY